MTTLHATTNYNVEASINQAFATALGAITLPSFLSTPAIVYDWPDITGSTPCFSIVHMPSTLSDRYQGRTDGSNTGVTAASGMMEISAWVNREQKYNNQDVWMPRLRFMGSMIESAYAGLSVILIKDYTSTPASPSSTVYKVNMNNLNFVQVAADPNPAIERRRALITYFWNLRV